MSDRDQPDQAVERVRTAFDRAVEEAGEMSEEVRAELEEAIYDVEARIEELRQRE